MVRKESHQKPPIAPREWIVAVCGSITLGFTSWGLGGVVTWSLHAMLFGGLLTLFFAICPLPSKLNGFDGRHGNWRNFKRLFLSPIFWFGTCFLIYITIQALNPAAEVVRDERGWWVEATYPPLAVWLPTSVRSDYEPMNAWRILVMHSAAVFLSLGLVVGLSRRLTTCVVLWSLFLNGTCMAMVAVIQNFSDTNKILWIFPSENPLSWGSFFYRNQCAAYFAWTILIGILLYFFHVNRSRKLGLSGGPHFLCVFLNAAVLFSAYLANSRAGIIFTTIIFLWFSILLFVDFCFSLKNGNQLSGSLIAFALVSMFACLLYFGANQVDWHRLQERFGGFDRLKLEMESGNRALASRATFDMANDRLHYGWGAGSFRYIFPMYQKNYPDLFYSEWLIWEGERGRDFYRYAHNDILQFLSEYGIVGVCLLLGMFGAFWCYCISYLTKSFYIASSILVASSISVVHAYIDFIYHSPAYWVAFLGVIGPATKLLYLDTR
ncbi:MAG: O-antigen ligase family protein [Verrucomicrobiota bacterium]